MRTFFLSARCNAIRNPIAAILALLLLAGTLAATPETMRVALAPGSALRAKLLSLAWSASGPSTDEYTPVAAEFQPPAETPIDVGPISRETLPGKAPAPGACTPQITKARGKLTSNGYLAIEGTCFGTTGAVLITGFPTGISNLLQFGIPALKTTTQLWTPTAITVQLPSITSVNDLTMHVIVKSGDQLSKPFDAKFTAALGDPVPLPSRYIVNNECAGGAIPGICDVEAPHPAIGSHADLTQQNGADIWTITIPAHFHLHAIHLVHLVKGATNTSVVNGGGNVKTFKVAWTEDPNTYTTATSTTQHTSSGGTSWDDIFSDIVTGGAAAAVNTGSSTSSSTSKTRVTIYTEAYRIEPLVRGPAGIIP